LWAWMKKQSVFRATEASWKKGRGTRAQEAAYGKGKGGQGRGEAREEKSNLRIDFGKVGRRGCTWESRAPWEKTGDRIESAQITEGGSESSSQSFSNQKRTSNTQQG